MRFTTAGLIFLLLLNVPGAAQAQPKPLGIALEGFSYPYPVNYLDLEIQQQRLKMAYMDVRPRRPNGDTVLLLHGKNFCGAYWGETASDLAEQGFRVIIPDQIGFCKSSKPDHFHYTFQQLARNTRAVLEALGVRQLSVLGHSMGGMLAARFALMYPERVEKLILENPIGLEDWKLKVPYKGVDYWYRRELQKDYESIKSYQLESYYDGEWRPEYAPWVDILAGMTLSPEYPRAAWNQALTYDMVFTQPVIYEFGRIEAPTLLIIGQRDTTALGKDLVSEEVSKTLGNYPELGKMAAGTIPDATLVELKGVGHLPHIETYERFIEPLLGFLNE